MLYSECMFDSQSFAANNAQLAQFSENSGKCSTTSKLSPMVLFDGLADRMTLFLFEKFPIMGQAKLN